MTYLDFTKELKSLKLAKRDFADEVGLSYNSVTNWKNKNEVPLWVDSWLKHYSNSKKFKIIKEMILTEL